MTQSSAHRRRGGGPSSGGEGTLGRRVVEDLPRILVIWAVVVAATLVVLWWMNRSGSRVLASLAYTSPSAWELSEVYEEDGTRGWQKCLELVNGARTPGQRLESALGVLKDRAVLEKAREDLLKAYEFNPTLADVPGMLADLAFWDGRESDAYTWRGEQAAVRKEWETALAQYQIAGETAERPAARIEEGILESLIRLNRWEEARELATELESAEFLTSRYYRLVAEIHRHEGNLEGEEAALRKALEVNPLDLEAVYALDSLLLRTNRLQEAYNLYDRTTDVVTNNGRLWHRQAKLATQLDRPSDAVELYKKGLEVQPNSFILHYELAQVYLSLGEEYKARPHLNRAMELNPGFFVDQKKKEGD